MLRWSDAELERALESLRREVVWPSTPALSRAVQSRVAQARVGAWRGDLVILWPRALAAALLAVLVLAGAVLALSPNTREAVADRLGLRGVSISHVEEVPPTPTAEATRTATSAPSAPGAGLGLGSRTDLAEARVRVSFAVLTPTALGDPDAVYVFSPNQVSLVWASPVLLTEFRARLDETLFQKGVPPNARLEEVRVGGGRGYWISGAPHSFFYRDAAGNVQQERSRLAGNTLLWEQNGLTLRLESGLDRDNAIRIAESLR
jgi:hypothetical protein